MAFKCVFSSAENAPKPKESIQSVCLPVIQDDIPQSIFSSGNNRFTNGMKWKALKPEYTNASQQSFDNRLLFSVDKVFFLQVHDLFSTIREIQCRYYDDADDENKEIILQA